MNNLNNNANIITPLTTDIGKNVKKHQKYFLMNIYILFFLIQGKQRYSTTKCDK